MEPGASKDEVTKAYRRLAKKYHPDLNPGDEEAAKKMAEVNAAYDSIMNGTPYGPRAHQGSSHAGQGGYASNPYEGYSSGGQQQQGGWYYGPYGSDGQQGGSGQYYDPFEEMFRAWQEASESDAYRQQREEQQRQQREQARNTANGCVRWVIAILVINMLINMLMGGCSAWRQSFLMGNTSSRATQQATPLYEDAESDSDSSSSSSSASSSPQARKPFSITTHTQVEFAESPVVSNSYEAA